MFINLRMFAIVAALVLAAGNVASANTMELTLTVPLKVTMPAAGTQSPALSQVTGAGTGAIKPFDVYCAVGTNLGYATGVGAQGNIVGQGSTATSGSKTVSSPDGKIVQSPTATVIITYDDGLSGAIAVGANAGGASGGKTVNAYLCWLQWKDPLPSIPPIFVQGALKQL
jgi:hypothetical protein